MLKLAVVVILLTACGPAERPTAEGQKSALDRKEDKVGRYLTTATTLLKIGNHLEASIFLEAALALGGEEHKILPRLIIAQVRAGRLRAAKGNIARFERLHQDQPSVKALGTLLDKLAPQQSYHGEVPQ